MNNDKNSSLIDRVFITLLSITAFALVLFLFSGFSASRNLNKQYPIVGEAMELEVPGKWFEKCYTHLFGLAHISSHGVFDYNTTESVPFKEIYSTNSGYLMDYITQVNALPGQYDGIVSDVISSNDGPFPEYTLEKLEDGAVEMRLARKTQLSQSADGYGFCTFRSVDNDLIQQVGFNLSDPVDYLRKPINGEVRFEVVNDALLSLPDDGMNR
ncbi:hypothetical protein [Roseovarius sp. MMSF_3359]|nr:hypothetical protein [Roseovarius sp. MMSF_3359]